jgi:hypothetical protein
MTATEQTAAVPKLERSKTPKRAKKVLKSDHYVDTTSRVAKMKSHVLSQSARTNEILGSMYKKVMPKKVKKLADAKDLRTSGDIKDPFKYAYLSRLEKEVKDAAKKCQSRGKNLIEQSDVVTN